MHEIWDQIQPTLSNVVVQLIQVLAVLVLGAIGYLSLKVKTFMDAKLSTAQRELLHKVSAEAFSYIEASLTSESSQTKLNKALDYASEKLGRLGVKVTAQEIKAAIEKACLEYNANKNKTIKDKAS